MEFSTAEKARSRLPPPAARCLVRPRPEGRALGPREGRHRGQDEEAEASDPPSATISKLCDFGQVIQPP